MDNNKNNAASRVPLNALVSTTTVSLATLLGEVVPENSVLYKDSGTWHFHEDETTFDNHKEADYTQGVNESFEDFIRRVVESLAKAEIERDDEHMIINTDLAIARSAYNDDALKRLTLTIKS